MRLGSVACGIVPFVATLVLGRTASADVPDPFAGCREERDHCTECSEYDIYADNSAYKRCVDKARADGLVETCRTRKGGAARANVYFCSAEFRARRSAGGCTGCAATAGSTTLEATLACVLALCAVVRRRR